MSELKFYEYSSTKTPKYLVIFLHGYGANGENLLSLSHEFGDVLHDAHFISPNAIEPWEGGFPDSYQWFSLYGGVERKDLESILQNIKNSNKILSRFIDEQLTRFGLLPKELFLVGFSQGAMMAIYQGLIRQEKIMGVVGFSGKVVPPEAVGDKILSKPEICLIHGESDSVVPFENFLEGKKFLEKAQIPFESHAIKNLDHSINSAGIKASQDFIQKLITQR